MSRRILNAHTGECLYADLDTCDTFEELKHLIAENAGVPEKRQVLLTPRGKLFKAQSLRNEEDIFVYDRDLIQGSGGQEERVVSKSEHLDFTDPGPVPQQPTSLDDVQAWLDTAQARSDWSAQVEESCRQVFEAGRRLAEENAVIQQGTAIAVDNLKQHLASLQQRYRQAKDWVDSLLAAQASFEEERGTMESRLAAVPASSQLQRFLKNRHHSKAAVKSVLDLLGPANLGDLSTRARKVSSKLQEAIGSIGASFGEASEKGESITQSFAQDFASSTDDLLEALDSHADEVGVLCKKVYDDCISMLRVGSGDTMQFSKTFSRHDKNLVPPLLDTVLDIRATVSYILERKQQLAADALAYMQRISSAESLIGQISQSFGRLELSAEEDATLESLDTIYRLPYVYGSLLIEIVRRREWTEKMTSDSTSLAEEMATYRDEEERRRKKWFKSVSHFVGGDLSGDVMGIDVSIRSAGDKYPTVTREDAASYADALQKTGGFDESVQELATMLKAIDAPSKQQAKRAHAFRSGSVNDQAFGGNSLLLRGDGETIRSLQAEKARLEERLRGSDSRVRKLEDLLHRQSQIQSRPSSRGGVGASYPYDRQNNAPSAIDGFSKMPVHPQSPGPYGSRRSSLVAQFQEHNPLAERVAHLEAELSSEKAKTAKLEETASKTGEREQSLRNEVQEATSTKQDLMDNFQAQQNEFEGERRHLEDENRKLKVKLEELEEAFDRMDGSHDNARLSLDERTKTLEQELRTQRERAAEELDRLAAEKETFAGEQERLQQQLEAVKQQLATSDGLKDQVENRVREMEETLRKHSNSQIEHHKSLRSVHSQLAADETAPASFDALVGAVEKLGVKASSHMQELQQALERARADNANQSKQLDARIVETRQLKSRFDQEELEVFSLREEVADRKARYASLETEFEDQRQDLENLRSKYSQNEDTLQTIRNRVKKQEREVADLNVDLTNTRLRNMQAEGHLSRLNERIHILEDVRNQQTGQLEAKSRRAEEISTRLFHQNELLLKLLSQVGFTATRQGGAYAFERTSRLANGGSSLIDPSPVVSRTPTGNMDASQSYDQRPPFVQWATSSDDTDVESEAFSKFLTEISSLKMDVVFETLVKRFKDIEHTARKWQREAKNYRERFHKSQFEAQGKIAFRTFKEGDLALFLPTRNQAPKRSWAAFNVGAPHYFLREQEHHTLKSREWLVARISRVEERVVDLSKNLSNDPTTTPNDNDAASTTTTEDDNPFGLSDGLRWYYLDAAEERLGAAPSTPGLGKSTTAAATEYATGSSVLVSGKKKPGEANAAAKVLTKSLDSRRSSTNSKKSTAGAMATTASAVGTFETGHVEGGGAAAAAASAVAGAGVGVGGGVDRTASDRSSLRRAAGSRGSREEEGQQGQQGQQGQEGRREQGGGWSSLWSMDLNLESGRKDGGTR